MKKNLFSRLKIIRIGINRFFKNKKYKKICILAIAIPTLSILLILIWRPDVVHGSFNIGDIFNRLFNLETRMKEVEEKTTDIKSGINDSTNNKGDINDSTNNKGDANDTSDKSSTLTPGSEQATEIRKVITTEPIPYKSSTIYDPNLAYGTRQVRVVGLNGLITHTYNVIYTDGVETSRTGPIDTVIKAIDEQIAIGSRDQYWRVPLTRQDMYDLFVSIAPPGEKRDEKITACYDIFSRRGLSYTDAHRVCLDIENTGGGYASY